MEKRRKDEPEIRLTMKGEKYVLRRDNSELILHEQTPKFDCFVFEKDMRMFKVFRPTLDNFDTLAEYMDTHGYNVRREQIASGNLIKGYTQVFGLEEPERHELTPRTDRKIAFARYLLDNEMITAQDFEREKVE